MTSSDNILSIKQKGWSLIIHLFLCIIVLQTTRLGFYFFNKSYFETASMAEAMLYGIRFDIAAICMAVGILFFILLLPLRWTLKTTRYWSIFFTFFFGVVVCFELTDWKYFPYNQARSNADLLNIIGREGDFLSLLPGFLKDYWILFIVAAVLIFGIYKVSRLAFKKVLALPRAERPNKRPLSQLAIAVLTAGVCVVGIRGGFQLVPITPRNAIQYTSNEHVALVLNSTFNIITSLQSKSISHLNYIDSARTNIRTIHYPDSTQAFIKKNIVVIILESFSKEFTGLSGSKSYTPFLDSLMQHSYVFENAYANSFQSIQGIPAILSGIPGLMDVAFSTSAYANNRITSFAGLLKPYGYHSTFYHNATNGSMSFDLYTQNAGYDSYFGRSEYNNEDDYDGNWGIWDEPFLQRVAVEISKTPQPFHAAVFNINSHPPYAIPEQYQKRFQEAGLPVYSAIRYCDYAVQQFFHKASTADWFEQTIFVFTADHCSPVASNDFYATKAGKFQIPIFIFDPSQQTFATGTSTNLTQQIDILPTVMESLHYPKPFYALGKNAIKETGAVVSKVAQNTYFIQDSLLLQLFNDSLNAVYLFPGDSMQTQNLRHEPAYKTVSEEQYLRYLMLKQVYINNIIDNKMTYD